MGVRRLVGVGSVARSRPPGGQRRCIRVGTGDARFWVLMVLAMAHLGSASRTHSGWDRVPASSKAVEGLEGRRRQTLRPGVLRLSGGADVLGEAAGGLQDLYMSCRFGSASSGVAAAASYARGCFGSISSGETGHPLWQGALVCCRLPNPEIP